MKSQKGAKCSFYRLDKSNKVRTYLHNRRVKMPWIKKAYNCGNCIIVKKYFASRYGAKREVLNITNKTTPQQQTINDRNAMFKYSILANANFKEGDYFITFTFKNRKLPDTLAECKEIWRKYRRKLRAVYKKKGISCKYIYAFEYDGCRPHFHLLCNNDGVNINEFPKWEYGTPDIRLLDDREYHTIGEYFCKVVYDDEKIKGKIKRKGDLNCSRGNLYYPEPDVEVLKSDNWDETPKADNGYEIDYDSLINGYVEVIESHLQFRYQSYRMIKLC